MIQTSWLDAQEICLVTAVDVEFNAAASLLASKTFSTESHIKSCRGHFGHRRIVVLQCGMGAHGFAERLSNYLENNHFNVLLIAGLAGGLDPQLKSGDAVIYDFCCDARNSFNSAYSKEKPSGRDQNASIRCDDEISESLFEMSKASGQRCFRGSGVTVDRIITEAKEKISLGLRYHASAVDMESFDVLRICAAFDLPAVVLRVISDEAESDLPNFNFAARADGRMDAWRTAAVMAVRPRASFGFLRSIKFVMKSLRRNLEVVLNA
jgi:nucleoside phosphorylase